MKHLVWQVTHSFLEEYGDKDKCFWMDLRVIKDLVLTGRRGRKEEKEQSRIPALTQVTSLVLGLHYLWPPGGGKDLDFWKVIAVIYPDLCGVQRADSS